VITLGALADSWNAFFHAREPATTIAVFRVCFGALVLANAVLVLRDARLWLGPSGMLPHDHYCEVYGHRKFTLLRYLPASDISLYVVLGIHMVAALTLTVGLTTRWSAIAVFVTLISVQHRNPLIMYGADDVLRVMSFLLIFSQAGEALSIDRGIAERSARVADTGTAWCTRLMQLQVSVIYFRAFLQKFRGRTWLEGTAVFYATELSDFQRNRLPSFARTLFWSKLGTWATLGVEFSLGPLVWIRELRYPIVAAGVILHIAMERFLNLHLFGATMIVCLVLFIAPRDLERLFRYFGLFL
jgi:hypothetical protein